MAFTGKTMHPNKNLFSQKGTLTNDEVRNLLGRKVAIEIFSSIDDATVVEIGSLSTNYFSFTFIVKVRTSKGSRDVFVKIPKADMRGRERSILPITSMDRRMAKEEESSLRLLGQKWDGDDLDVRWVNLRGTIPEYNAIVTDRVFADEALPVLRRLDLRRRLGYRNDAQRMQHSMARIGSALGRFHQTNSQISVFQLSSELTKFEFYCRELSLSTKSACIESILRKLRTMGNTELAGIKVPTLKGIDIRNIIIDAQDKIYLMDPGRIKFTYREADLARFLMTYRILYWGSKLFLLFREPDSKPEASFLKAYYSYDQPPCPQLLNLFFLKEQLKHWHTALDSLQRGNWPPVLKRLVAWIYVNRFYTRQVRAQLQLIGK
ncbi:MAG: hypothetical protein HQK78_00260 [Desulfobacterales bacterium]|nr:hypothetical protein [Desulfobacterales bacterium]